MSKSTLPSRPTAAQVRAAVKANPALVESLSEKARHTLDSRGRMHGEVIAAYNKGKRAEKRYSLGNTASAKAQTAAARAKAVEAGLTGTRGPLSRAARESLSQPKG